MKKSRVRMIVKWCRGRSEGSRDGSSPRDLISSCRDKKASCFSEMSESPNSYTIGAGPTNYLN
jgi:hypothetical protein